MSEVETIRRQFLPQRITALFVGESAPQSGKVFYLRNGQVYRYMRQAFTGGPDFLEWFKANGYFLDDLILDPVNKKAYTERRRLRCESVLDLARRLSDYRPAVVVALMIGIEPMVRDAIAKAGLSDRPFHVIPFPGCGQQGRFSSKMAEIIPKLPKLQS